MVFTVDNKKIEGEATLHCYEDSIDDQIFTFCQITLALSTFLPNISKIEFAYGEFTNLELITLTIGTKERQVLYQLRTKDYVLSASGIQNYLKLSHEGNERQ